MCSGTVSRKSLTRALALSCGAALLFTNACGGHYLARGVDLYDDARYVEAAEVFEKTEPRLAHASNEERARFGLYRGATFLELGDALHAARWLGYARSVVNADPESLDQGELSLLETALKTLASVKTSPPGKDDTEVAAAPVTPPR